MRGGVPSRAISYRSYPAAPTEANAAIRIAFARNGATTAACGPWQDQVAQTGENRLYGAFGCASQQNLAAMVSNPLDLAYPRASTPPSGDRRNTVVKKYENGDVIVCYLEQRHPLSSFYGEEAAVRLKTGERYLKTIERGKGTGLVNLSSFNAKPINGVKLDWIGEICVTLPRGQIARLRAKAASRARKAKSR